MKEENRKFLETSPQRPRAPVIIITSSSQSDFIGNDAEEKPSSDKNGGDVEIGEMVAIPPEEMITDRQARKNWILALFLLLIYVTLVVTSSQLTSSAFRDELYREYKAPWLFIWCKVMMRTLAFPSVFLIQIAIRLVKGHPIELAQQWKHSTSLLSADLTDGEVNGKTDDSGARRRGRNVCAIIRIFMKKYMPMSVSMLLMQIGWVVGLVHSPASIVTALCSATIAFSYLLSWLVLKNKMLLVKGLFVIVAFAGIGLISYGSTEADKAANAAGVSNLTCKKDVLAEVFEHENTTDCGSHVEGAKVYLGVICGIAAAICYSLHGLAFKMAFPKADLMQVAFIMTFMSLTICVMYLPGPLIVWRLGYENWVLSKMPWHIMFSSWFLAYISSVAYAYGLSLSNPFFMSVGEVLIVALSTGADTFFRGIDLSAFQIAGTSLVALAFIFMVMPDNWLSLNLKGRCRSPSEKEKASNGDLPAELLQLNPKSPAKDV